MKKKPQKPVKKPNKQNKLQFLGITLALLLLVSGCKAKTTAPEITVKDSCDRLISITRDCFAPGTQEQYTESYQDNKALFTEGEADKLYNYGTKTVTTGIQPSNIDVVYSYKNDSNDCLYRVTMDLRGEDGTTHIDVYYYVNPDGKISKTIVQGGGNGRI